MHDYIIFGIAVAVQQRARRIQNREENLNIFRVGVSELYLSLTDPLLKSIGSPLGAHGTQEGTDAG